MLLRSFQRLISLREFGLSRGLPAAWQAAILHSAAAPAPTDPPPLEPPPADSDSAVDLDSPLLPPPPERQRLLQVAVVGAPNAGKSTLTNALVGSKVSAVSAKTNTTERSALGAMTVGDAQVVLFDTPGVVASRHYRGPVHTRRVQSAWRVARDADLLLFLVDAARQLERPDPRVEQVVADYGERVRESQHAAAEAAAAKAAALAAPAAERETAPPGEPRTRPQAGQPEGLETEQQAAPAAPGAAWPPALLLLNKVDAVSRDDRPHLLPLAERFSGLAPFEDVFYISAKHGQGMQQLRELLLSRATPGEWTLPDPQAATDRSDTELALEVVREKLFQRLYRELPYRLQLRPVSLAQLRDGSLRVEQEIVAPSQGARAIVVGHGGSVVGAVGADARAELAALWGRPVHLVLKVKVAGKHSL